MMSEEDKFMVGGGTGAIPPGGSVTPSSVTTDTRYQYLAEPATVAEATAAFSKFIAEGRTQKIPGVSAIASNRGRSADRTDAYYIPFNFNEGVFTFSVDLVKEARNNSNVAVRIAFPGTVTIDGKAIPQAASALVGSEDYIDPYVSGDTMQFAKSPMLDRGLKPTVAKMTLTVSSRMATREERNADPKGGIRKITVKSIKFEPSVRK